VNLHAEAVAQRYAMRPGCRFLGFREVGLAVFAMNLRVLIVEPRQMSPIDEFILRLMGQAIVSVGQISRLLGLDRAIVRDRLVELRRNELIDVTGDDSEDGECCGLTERGQIAAHELVQSAMHEITLPNVMFHGLVRKPVDIGGRARRQFLQPREAKEAGLTLVRALPNRYPRPEEIDVSLLDKLLKSGPRKSSGQGVERNIVAVKGLLKRVFTLYEPAVMLEYQTVDDKHERQVAFVVEGQLNDGYEAAFASGRGPALLKDILTPATVALPDRIRQDAPADVVHRLGRIEDVEELASRVAHVSQQVDDAKAELKSADRPDTRQVLRERIEQLESNLADTQQQRDARKVKYLWTPEIKEKLWEAIETATDRLLILSGWVSSEVVNEAMITALRAALARGVRIWIGYGFDKGSRRGEEQRGRSTWQEAEKALRRLQKEFRDSFTFRDIGYTHEKRLICDTRFVFGGSFNLLSFSGERRGRGRLRHEGADLIEDERYCEDLYARYLKQFFAD
jgi:PLD-like domain